jgi:hypothetical protein
MEYDGERRLDMTDVSFEDIKELFRETDKKVQEMSRQIGHLGNRLGEFVEGVVRPGLVRLFREAGVDVRETHQDLESARDGLAMQVDLLVVNDTDAVVVEVKSKLSQRDVDEHLERLALFKRLFPRYADARLMGAMAAMVIPQDAADYAERKGLFVIGQSGEDAVLMNAPGFAPMAW